MSVILKKSQIKVKDESGNYTEGINVIADKKSSEVIEEIENAASTALQEITNSTSGFVKNTDYATASKAGIIVPSYGFNVNPERGTVSLSTYDKAKYDELGNYGFVGKGTLENILPSKVKEYESVSDVAIDGKSIINTDGIAEIPTAKENEYGLVRANQRFGIYVAGNEPDRYIRVLKASENDIDSKIDNYKPIVPSNLEYAVTSVVDFESSDNPEQVVFVEEKDLEHYVKDDSRPTGYGGKAGIINTWADYGLTVPTGTQRLQIYPATNDDIDSKKSVYRPIVPANLEKAVKSVLDFRFGEDERVTFVEENDLEHYVKDTDVASQGNIGLCGPRSSAYGLGITSTGLIYINSATEKEIDARTSSYRPIVPSNLEYALKSVGDGIYVRNDIIEKLFDETLTESSAISITVEKSCIYAFVYIQVPNGTTINTMNIESYNGTTKGLSYEFTGGTSAHDSSYIKLEFFNDHGYWNGTKNALGRAYMVTKTFGGIGNMHPKISVESVPTINKFTTTGIVPAGCRVMIWGC